MLSVQHPLVQLPIDFEKVILRPAVDHDGQLTGLQAVIDRPGLLGSNLPVTVRERYDAIQLLDHRMLVPQARIFGIGSELLADLPVARKRPNVDAAAHRSACSENVGMPEREPQRAMTAHAVSRDRPSTPRAYRSVKGVHTAHQLRAHISFIPASRIDRTVPVPARSAVRTDDDRPVRRSRAGKFGFGFTQPAIVTVIVAVQQVNDRIAASRIGIVSFGKNHQILDLLVHRRAVHANGVHPLSASRNPAHKKRCHPHDPKPERNVSTKAFAIFHVSCCQSPAKIANRKINESTRPIKSCMSYGKRVESPYRIKAMSANGPPRTRTAIKTQKSAPIGADFLWKGESHFRFFVHV